jgi:hypothetical protein
VRANQAPLLSGESMIVRMLCGVFGETGRGRGGGMTCLWVCCRSVLLCWWTDLVCMAREALAVADVFAMLL